MSDTPINLFTQPKITPIPDEPHMPDAVTEQVIKTQPKSKIWKPVEEILKLRMSHSRMSDFKRSPRHYLHYLTVREAPTPALIFGSAFHMWVLKGEDEFNKKYTIIPDSAPKRPTAAQRNAKKPSDESIMAMQFWDDIGQKVETKTRELTGKERWKLMTEEDKDNKKSEYLLNAESMETIKRMDEALKENKYSYELLSEIGETEFTLKWKDDVTGVRMKGILDGKGKQITIDLKTTTDAEPDNFARDMWNYGSHRQAALYLDGREANGLHQGDFYFIACEKDPPYAVSVNKCSQSFIREGRMSYGKILENYAYWIQLGCPDVTYEWLQPLGYFNLEPPKWIK